jgi:hypothetical protein
VNSSHMCDKVCLIPQRYLILDSNKYRDGSHNAKSQTWRIDAVMICCNLLQYPAPEEDGRSFDYARQRE